MLFPTLTGLVSSTIKVISATAESEAFTPQEATDAMWGGATAGAVAISLRTRSVVRKQLGDQALAKYKQGLVGGLV